MLAPLLAHWRERPQRTWSVIVTLFGDAVAPRGGSVWLGTLLEVCAAMGVDAGAVRTAMSRLVADGWTERQRAGRNSYYRLAERGRDTFAAASTRIYAAGPPAWDGRFHLLLSPDRAVAEAAGYGQALPGLFVATHAAAATGLALWATPEPGTARALAAAAWPLDRLAASFSRFADTFAPLAGWAGGSGLDALVARTLLIHEYRRIVLHAPDLPAAMLPPAWPGDAARSVAATAYAALLTPSEAWLDAHAQALGGPLPPPGPDLRQRFS